MRKVYCDYCGRETEYVDSKVIYGKSYGKIYLCRNCMAYVGVHKGTDKPLGRLANAELRNWKKAAHAVFDPLWKYGRFRGHRNAAYAWLAQKMGLPVERPTSECLMSASAARPSKSLRKKRKETVMEDTKKTPAELVADLMLDPGFVLVPQDRYEELIRAETERDVLEATIKGENSYNVERVLDAIQQARSALYRMKMLVLRNADEPEDTADAE